MLASALVVISVVVVPGSSAGTRATGWTAVVVNDLSSSDSVSAIDTGTNQAGAAVGVGSLPLGIAITPDARTAYVANAGATPNTGSVTPIDLTTSPPTAGTPIDLTGHVPNFIAISPNGTKAYVSDPQNGSVVPMT
jgi:YVTN family beta-propeller protein